MLLGAREDCAPAVQDCRRKLQPASQPGLEITQLLLPDHTQPSESPVGNYHREDVAVVFNRERIFQPSSL